jgi:DNA-binding MarR family transcriptional regulator
MSRDRALDDVRAAFGELLGAERRLRGRDPHRPGELSAGQVRALFQLERDEEVTAGELAKRAELSPASMTVMLDQLERDGVVRRRRSEIDRRQVIVSLTDAGRERVAERREAWTALWRDRLAGHGDDELDSAARVMRTVAGLLDGLGR